MSAEIAPEDFDQSSPERVELLKRIKAQLHEKVLDGLANKALQLKYLTVYIHPNGKRPDIHSQTSIGTQSASAEKQNSCQTYDTPDLDPIRLSLYAAPIAT